MWVYDTRSLAFLAVNDETVKYYGYSLEEFLGMSVPQLYLPADRSSVLDAELRSHVSSNPKETWRHVKKDGTVVYVELVRSHVPSEDEGLCLVMANDVSEGKRFELLYRMLLDAIPSSVLLLDEDLCVVVANRNFLEKSRQTNGVAVGKRLNEVFPEVIVTEMGLEQQIRSALRNNKSTQGQRLTYRAPGVPLRVYYYSVVPVNWGGQVDHVLLLMDDVTEQTRMGEEIRRMERHLASVVESASDIVVSTDIHGNILTWNRAAQKTSGYSFEELKGLPFLDYCDRSGAASIRRVLSKKTSGESPTRIECGLKTKAAEPVRFPGSSQK